MCQLFETIKVFRGVLQHIEYHSARVNRSRHMLYGANDVWDLSTMIRIPDLDSEKVYRCRFLYGKEPAKIEFLPYARREIQKLYLVECESLDYTFKYADRLELEALKNQIPDPDIADVLIIKNGRITDTSIANIVFSDGEKWYTPSTPLLGGTRRQFHLDRGDIAAREIPVSDLHLYKSLRLINAMIGMDESNDIPVEQII